jgi:hypothetical protein
MLEEQRFPRGGLDDRRRFVHEAQFHGPLVGRRHMQHPGIVLDGDRHIRAIPARRRPCAGETAQHQHD